MTYRITYFGGAGTIYSELDSRQDEMEVGEWTDIKEDTMLGLVECITQNDMCPPVFQMGEVIVKVKVEKVEDETREDMGL